MKKLYFSKNSLVLLIGFFIISCKDSIIPEPEKGWGKTTATITAVEAFDGKYGYTIEYPIPESTAVKEGKKIEDPIKQHGIADKRPILNQKIPLQYLKEEPIMFKLLKPIQYE